MVPAIGLSLIVAGILLWQWAPSLDAGIFDALRFDGVSGWAPSLRAFTHMGGIAALGPLALVVVIGLAWRGRHGQAIWLLLTIASGRLAVEIFKAAFARPRPSLADRLAEVTSYSFPSSHSAGSMLTWLALAMVLPLAGRAMVAPAIALAAMIGLSRILLGVHYPSDVIAGLGFGMLWVGMARRWLPAA